jgi:acylphosphatase
MKNVKIKVFGRVQRIGFRFSAMQTAYKYGVKGIVQNSDDGSVYMEAEGEDKDVDLFVAWCRRGPVGAKVDEIRVENGEVKNYSSFEIVHY